MVYILLFFFLTFENNFFKFYNTVPWALGFSSLAAQISLPRPQGFQLYYYRSVVLHSHKSVVLLFKCVPFAVVYIPSFSFSAPARTYMLLIYLVMMDSAEK